jgi:hypothetical protein
LASSRRLDDVEGDRALGDEQRIRAGCTHRAARHAPPLGRYRGGGLSTGAEIVDASTPPSAAFGNVEAAAACALALDVGPSVELDVVFRPGAARPSLRSLVTAATEERYEIVGFFAGRGGFRSGWRSVHRGYVDGLTPLAVAAAAAGRRRRRCRTCRSAARTAPCRCCTQRQTRVRSTRS